MSPLALELVRRLSVLAVVLAAALLVVPWALNSLGVIGPDVQDRIGAAERALQVAREYGGVPTDAEFQKAEAELASARRLAGDGDAWQARRAAGRAAEQAVAAQRVALTAREGARRQVASVGADIDRKMNDLEELYARLAPEMGKTRAEAFVPRMKSARRAGAAVLLAIEEGDYRRALEMAPEALANLDEAHKNLESAATAPAARPAQTAGRS
jgi:hypothetical protein